MKQSCIVASVGEISGWQLKAIGTDPNRTFDFLIERVRLLNSADIGPGNHYYPSSENPFLPKRDYPLVRHTNTWLGIE
jgi:hypothetical protein